MIRKLILIVLSVWLMVSCNIELDGLDTFDAAKIHEIMNTNLVKNGTFDSASGWGLNGAVISSNGAYEGKSLICTGSGSYAYRVIEADFNRKEMMSGSVMINILNPADASHITIQVVRKYQDGTEKADFFRAKEVEGWQKVDFEVGYDYYGVENKKECKLIIVKVEADGECDSPFHVDNFVLQTDSKVNFVTNCSFETTGKDNGWTMVKSGEWGVADIVEKEGRDNSKAMRLDMSISEELIQASTWVGDARPDFDTRPDAVLSVWARGKGKVQMVIEKKNGDSDVAAPVICEFEPTEEWNQYSMIVPGSTSYRETLVHFKSLGDGDGVVYLDDVRLEYKEIEL